MRKTLFGSMLAVALAIGGSLLTTQVAFAYGSADQPIAQVEISANCNNPDFGLCQEVGLGGVWAWAELGTVGGNTTSGEMDSALTFCGHSGPGGGAHCAGGFGHPVEGQWWTVNNLIDALSAGAFPFFDTSKSYGSYYILDFFHGSGSDDFIAVVPAAYGHYPARAGSRLVRRSRPRSPPRCTRSSGW